MAFRSGTYKYPSPSQLVFTTFTADINLQTINSAFPFLPTGMIVSNLTSGNLNFVWEDATGTTNILIIGPNESGLSLPFSAAKILAATSDTLTQVLVYWSERHS